jgi:hypothetical protein
VLAITSLLGGCSSFNRDWKATGRCPDPGDDFAGRWQGTWLSDVNGHTEQLRSLIAKVDGTNYLARFQAKYRKGIRFTVNYRVPLSVERLGDTNQFRGEADLGWLSGGVYRYAGHASATNFYSTYECKYDHGTFQMTRPPLEP